MALDKRMKIEYSSMLQNMVDVNPSFDSGQLRIAYTGTNRNKSFISKDAFEAAIPTMFGCPIVANYIREENEIGSHDGEIVEDTDGDVKYVNITEPVGFVPPNAKWWWEDVEDDGVIHQYLNTEVILWKRQEAYQKIKDNGITKQSMEIYVDKGVMCDDYYRIDDFTFTAFCLLGTAEPCFESASLYVFDYDNMRSQMNEMFEEFKREFAINPIEKEENQFDMKLKELLDKYNKKIEDIDFEYETLNDEELEAKFAEVFDDAASGDAGGDISSAGDDGSSDGDAGNTDDTGEGETNNGDGDINTNDDGNSNSNGDTDDYDVSTTSITPNKNKDYGLASQLRNSLNEALSVEKVDYDGYQFTRYWMIDYDESISEVYFEDYNDGWKLFGAPYIVDGDTVSIDFDNKKRKKYAIVDFIEGEVTFSLGAQIETTIGIAQEKYNELLNKYDAIVLKDKEEQASILLDKFAEDLGDMPEYNELVENSVQYSLKDLEDKLYALVGRKQKKFEQERNGLAAPIINDGDKPVAKPYGNYFDFLNK